MQRRPRRILCAEAHTDTYSMLSRLFAESAYEIKSAKTVAEALSLATSQHFDLYLLTDRYTDGDALELCEQIRASHPHTPILFFSTYARETDRQSGLDAGAQAYLVKPRDIFELKETVAQLIEQAESPAGLERRIIGSDQRPLHTDERRRRRRICQAFPAIVYGADSNGNALEVRTKLENLSAGGLYMRLPHHLEKGAKLSIVIRPSTAPSDEASPVFVAVNGNVLRSERQAVGGCSVGVILHETDFFKAWSWALR